MVSHDSLVRAEKRLGVPAVIGRFHKAPRQLQDDYELDDKVGWNHGPQMAWNTILALHNNIFQAFAIFTHLFTHIPHADDIFFCGGGYNSARLVWLQCIRCLALQSQLLGVLCGTLRWQRIWEQTCNCRMFHPVCLCNCWSFCYVLLCFAIQIPIFSICACQVLGTGCSGQVMQVQSWGDVSKNSGKTPQNGWFIMMENPMNKWMIWGENFPPIFGENHPHWWLSLNLIFAISTFVLESF